MMVRVQYFIGMACLGCLLAACGDTEPAGIQRPADPWAFRSVLDKQPRMLTLALDSSCYAAYDLARCILYKVWKGGVLMEGTAYTNKKNIQPTSWGSAWYSDSIQQFQWVAGSQGKRDLIQKVRYKGYVLQEDRIRLKYALLLSSADSMQDTVYIEEQPEFIRSKSGKPGFERSFTLSGVPEGVTVSLKSRDTTLVLRPGKITRLAMYFDTLPPQTPPDLRAGFDHTGRYWMEKSDCFTCHEMVRQTVGPSFRQIARRYQGKNEVMKPLIQKVRSGGSGTWGTAMMTAHPDLAAREIKTMLDYILSLDTGKVENITEKRAEPEAERIPRENNPVKPGFGASLEGVHPSFTLRTIRPPDFRPRVGGLAFLPSGDLLVTTWDSVGGVYRLDGVETGDSSKISVKRIASGLAEPLGLEVVAGEIFVLQKQELTHLIDLDGDEVIDEYRAVCNSWGVSADFHEFAFGLVWKDGYFYATLSLAMRLMAHEQQKADRGRTIRISRDGRYEWINYGLRTPNGIGLGLDGEIFVTDNQGQWLPANKLIHVRKGDFHGMRWGLPDSVAEPPPVTPPTLWLPQDEIANSPSEPILIPDGPYKGQMLHGDVTHGGIKRDFLEKVEGEYQGAVFRFTQGLEAGVNRLCWGPDGALYIGGVGMVGGWSWKGKQYGLQRMEYSGKTTFEMLAVRAKRGGFEIAFTEALDIRQEIQASDFFLQQWWYLPTADYGGPRKDLETLEVTRTELSEDRTRVYLEIPGLKEEHVVYFRLPEDLQSMSGQSLWSSEAWYTLNNIPGS